MVSDDSFSALLQRARHGNTMTINDILVLYAYLIKRRSFINGAFDEECQQYIMLRVAKQIPKFRGEGKTK